MFPTELLLTAILFGSTATAHIAPIWPYPFRASYNPNSVSAKIDYSITSPLSGASQFPCKGYQVDMGTTGGESVVSWAQGGAYNFTTGSGALHGGGSCQIALSYDKGVTFNVIHSYIGSCPISADESFDFTMPSDAPTGAAMFAWTWYNMIGNREIYMDCASVTITAASSKTRSASSVAFSDRPTLWVGNLDNGCTTIESTEVVFPNPGPDVTNKLTTSGTSISGTCAAVSGIGGPAAAGSGSSSSATASSGSGSVSASSAGAVAASSSSSTASTLTSVYTVPSVTATPATGATSTASPAQGGIFVTSGAAAASGAAATSSAHVVGTGVASSAAAASTGSSSGTGTAITAGTACTTEGMWNCVGGSSFQQCASGTWSVVQSLAAGTSCTGTEASTLDIVRRGPRPRPVRKQW
ncbi:hypothetical protein BP5796_03839 [Coleophoma crateriformis]|uniref:Uncharacterized protein n=1 Tax=Coleophoma crateriformis TaxID=565419 RepID=A0A3D8SH86_9HELO|nr:hypothetical protein BP5796_03839 [Coleophoma crateriformis]